MIHLELNQYKMCLVFFSSLFFYNLILYNFICLPYHTILKISKYLNQILLIFHNKLQKYIQTSLIYLHSEISFRDELLHAVLGGLLIPY